VFRLFARKNEDPREELKHLLGDYEVPSMPSTAIKLLGLLRDPDTPMAEIAGQVEMDPGLTVRVLQLINSAAFGLLSQVSNLQHATSLLGRSRLESLVLAFAAAETVPRDMGCLEPQKFWEAAARRATLARLVAQRLHAATQAEAFTAGLLQDIAVPLLAGIKPEAYAKLLDRWHQEPGADLDAGERELFGYDHATVGALMAEDWGLPEYLIQAVGGHHSANGEADVDPAVRLVALLRYDPENDGRDHVLGAAESMFGIERPLAEEMMTKAFADAGQVAGMFCG
jgi:HD-like signal output (HDOD) protein